VEKALIPSDNGFKPCVFNIFIRISGVQEPDTVILLTVLLPTTLKFIVLHKYG
jgi:hypothetical protein